MKKKDLVFLRGGLDATIDGIVFLYSASTGS